MRAPEMVQMVSKSLTIPVTVGGGIKNPEIANRARVCRGVVYRDWKFFRGRRQFRQA